ncbi:MAG TPA: type II toxin-antitoxin system VapC family toxin [Longimicrobiales bacterium]
MIFVDTNVFMYAVGRSHPLREEARAFFIEHAESGEVLVTSAEVMQELMHAYLAAGRETTLDAALELLRGRMGVVWPIEPADVDLAHVMHRTHAALGARDLLHVACCARRGVERVKTYDRALAAAFA